MTITTLELDGVDAHLDITLGEDSHIREGGRYEFRLNGSDRTIVSIEPRELFSTRSDAPNLGVFRPEQCVGDVRVVIAFDDGARATTDIAVRSTKLRYETEYREMLAQVADHAAEAVLQGFAPASLDAHVDPVGEARTIYQSLAFLVSRFRDEDFLAAIERIRNDPHRGWETRREQHGPGTGLRAGPDTARSLQRGGEGILTPRHLSHLPSPYLPRRIDIERIESTHNTYPNRFIRHVFARWQGIALEIGDRMGRDEAVKGRNWTPGPIARGIREARWLADQCERVLAIPAIREAGTLDRFPSGNQVLYQRPGYREVLRTFALAEASMALDATLPDDPFSATQRNVATLYEYWCFIALTDCISRVVGRPAGGLLFEPSGNGLSLVLKQGEASRLSWDVEMDHRVLTVDLWFNRTFKRNEDPRAEIGSWARQLRPDASLRIRPKSARPNAAKDTDLDVWVHFDAKYRIESLQVDTAIEGADVEAVNDREPGGASGRAKREDLLKMHAYRDAIRRSAGAYVLYPGIGEQTLVREFHELLPGIGAFPLRPESGGGIGGRESLEQFLREIARQAANQASAMERTRFWTARYNTGRDRHVRPVDFLERPPDDTVVLVGYVRPEQLRWTTRTRQYNVRAGNRSGSVDLADAVLTADIVVLWTSDGGTGISLVGVFERTGPWIVATGEELGSTGYPTKDPTYRYLVTGIDPLPVDMERQVRFSTIENSAGRASGEPWATTWATLTGDDHKPT